MSPLSVSIAISGALAGALALCAGSAHAAPRKPKKPAPVKPEKPVPAHACAPEYADAPELTVAAGKLVACWKRDPSGCIELARGAPPLRLPADPPKQEKPAAPKPAAKKSANVRDGAACAGSTCKPLGPVIRAALEKSRAWSERARYTQPRVSDDLRFLAVENQLFAIADDRRVAIAPPAELTGDRPDRPRFAGVAIAGNLAIASWATCAGSCLVSAAVDDRGAARAPTFPGGAPLVLDGKRVAILPLESRATVTILDRASGQPAGATPIHDGISRGYLGILADAQTLVALSSTDAAPGWQIAWLSVPPGKPPSLLATQTIPLCP